MNSSDPVLRLARYRPFVVAMLCVAMGLAAFELVFGSLLGFSPKLLWTGIVPNEWYDKRNNGQLVAGADLSRQRSSQRGLALMVGSSTTRYSMTPKVLDRCDGLDLDWMVITSTRMSFTVMEDNVFVPLDLAPALAKLDLLVLGMHPEMLVGASEETPTFAEAVAAVRDELRHRHWAAAASAMVRASFIVHIRGRIANTVEQEVNTMRLGGLRALGQPLAAIYYPPSDFQAERIPADGNTLKSFSAPVVREYVQKWNALGYSDASRFSARGEQADALRRILARFPGVPVVFVIMPVRSEFRVAKTLPAIGEVWDGLFRELGATRNVSVVDLSDRLANDAFKDIGHANLRGRALLQRLVPRALALAAGGEGPVPSACALGGEKEPELRRVVRH